MSMSLLSLLLLVPHKNQVCPFRSVVQDGQCAAPGTMDTCTFWQMTLLASVEKHFSWKTAVAKQPGPEVLCPGGSLTPPWIC